MDLAPLIAWSVPIIGLLLAIAIGVADAKAATCIGWFAALGIAFVIGVVFMFAQVFLNGFCIETLKRCASHGDGNMSYWFQSFMAIPLYWLCIAGISRLRHHEL